MCVTQDDKLHKLTHYDTQIVEWVDWVMVELIYITENS